MENYVEILKEKVGLLPSSPGVYQFLNSGGEVIYVGKAKNLKKRVQSYFMSNKVHAAKVKIMVRHIRDLKYIVVQSETDALLLENNLIKDIQPRYNVMLKDDKTYPWIVVRNEPFPRVMSTRTLLRDGSRYFGPYASVVVQKNMLDLVTGIYQLRTCSLNLAPEHIAKGKYSVCLQYHLGNCKAPCVGAQNQADYAENIDRLMRTLSGDLKSTRSYLVAAMNEAAANLQFEQAHLYKMRLELLENYESKSVIVNSNIGDVDVFSFIKDIDSVYCNFMRVKNGALINSFTAELSAGIEENEQDILTRAIITISEKLSGELAREVLVPFLPEETLFPGVRFTVPRRGDKLKLLDFSTKSARIYRLDKLKNLEVKDPARHTERILESMRRELHMNRLPRHIECFDNSNLQGTDPVASCVVFRDAKPSRSEYRHFNIKTVVGPDDFASMKEIVGRRYTRLINEGKDLPDLIVIDGGKGQLSAAYNIIKELGIEDRVTIVGLAKRIEEVYFPQDPMPYYLDRTGQPLKVLMHIRDEAHRFGITFHRTKRAAGFIKSELEEIPGLGPVNISKLLKKFKTVKAIRMAKFDDLAAVIGKSKASSVVNFFEFEKGGVKS